MVPWYTLPIGSMYAIYGNMDPINIPPMLAYIPAPCILWVIGHIPQNRSYVLSENWIPEGKRLRRYGKTHHECRSFSHGNHWLCTSIFVYTTGYSIYAMIGSF